MEDRPVYSYIPKNINATGGLFGGAVDTRRLIEAVIGAGIAVVLYRLISIFIHSEVVLYTCGFLGVALFAAGMAGGNGEPLSIFLLNFINYENRRIFVTLRPPMPDFGAKKKKLEKEGPAPRDRVLGRINRMILRKPGKKEQNS